MSEPTHAFEGDGRIRAVVEAVSPSVDGGRYPVKRIVGDTVVVEADCFADGHDLLAARVLWRRERDADWREASMGPIGNDRWRGSFKVEEIGRYLYTVCAWIDPFLSWRHDFERRADAEDLRIAALAGAALIDCAAARAAGGDRARLEAWATQLRSETDAAELRRIALDAELGAVAAVYPDRRFTYVFPAELALVVDREQARFSAWYEMFPRSASGEAGRHGTFRDCAARLPYIAKMGFDVLYFPPIHPIGRARRKGKNNALAASAEDVGSPWAIGSAEGGHKSVHPALGTLEEFHELVRAARGYGIEIALDIAFQCAPDHPYVKEHPQWFCRRADGSVQYAENPPKKYEDIYPFNFESDRWRELWAELESVFEFWIGQGVAAFRVDNPHTKAFPFWEWAIDKVKRKHPEAIFLSEAFTRPKVMHRLAKLGFSQSYTYFAWRNTAWEITEYFTELARGPGREYLRANLWPNTPDILTEYLQFGGRPAFMIRLVLAATLGASYGIYGPAFELAERDPRDPGSEEYRDSEKYQLRDWDLDRSDSLAHFIGRLNKARRENPALHSDWNLRFYPVDNENMICYAKTTPEGENAVLTVVNLDPYHAQSGWVELDLRALGLEAHASYQVHELLSGARYLWSGPKNYVSLDPGRAPAHIFRLRRRIRTERDFDYFL
ncbi:MAG: alpha-1,4-glucan--maltose-1-phosphate maltosyltransferase [Betaproteobacteria bacterium]|nr:alpha-1,4-glucan--maltose-1-phosphate maltosyltransferase [Betaproteobacteria bacterium]